MEAARSFLNSLKKVLELTKQASQLKIEQIFTVLGSRGVSALVVLFSLPFTFPIQIPGFSTPFGLVLAFLGSRLALSKPLWCPRGLREKSFSSPGIAKLVGKTIKVVEYMQRFLRPRLRTLIKNPVFNCLNGFLIFILALILALPLPIPLSNMLTAFPMLSLGLGLLEEDGVLILIGYALSLVCFGAFFCLFLLGKAQFS